jgi:hypothetical protein
MGKVWKTIKVSVKEAQAIVEIDEKLPNHLKEIESFAMCIVPEQRDAKEGEYGELSLSFNNKKEHAIHTTVEHSSLLMDSTQQIQALNQDIQTASHIQGYYRDNGFATTEEGEFTPYTLKILFECKSQ